MSSPDQLHFYCLSALTPLAAVLQSLARLTLRRSTTATKERAFQGDPQAEDMEEDGLGLNHRQTLPGDSLSTQMKPQSCYRFHIYPDSSSSYSGGPWFLT